MPILPKSLGRWPAVAEWVGFAAVAIVAHLRFGAAILAPAHPVDEERYFAGFLHFVATGDPYEAYGAFYPPSFYWLGARCVELVGERGLTLAMRIATASAIAAVAWLAARATERSWAQRLGLATATVVVFPPFLQAMELGNVSPVVVAFSLAALALWPARPVVGGTALALALAVKPLGAMLVPIVPMTPATPARRRAHRPSAMLSAVALLFAGGLVLAAGTSLLPRFLDGARHPLLGPYQISFEGVFAELSLRMPIWVPIAAISLLAWRLRFRDLEEPLFRAVAPALAVAAAPIVWLHSLAFALPVILRSLFGPRAFSTALGRRLDIVVRITFVAGIFGAGSTGAVRSGAWPIWFRAFVALIPLASVLGLTERCLADHRRRGS